MFEGNSIKVVALSKDKLVCTVMTSITVAFADISVTLFGDVVDVIVATDMFSEADAFPAEAILSRTAFESLANASVIFVVSVELSTIPSTGIVTFS